MKIIDSSLNHASEDTGVLLESTEIDQKTPFKINDFQKVKPCSISLLRMERVTQIIENVFPNNRNKLSSGLYLRKLNVSIFLTMSCWRFPPLSSPLSESRVVFFVEFFVVSGSFFVRTQSVKRIFKIANLGFCI